MPVCAVRWRPSGGRGEYEFVPADALDGRDIVVLFEPLGVQIPSEVRGEHKQGKPRLRKFDSNNRKKMHLPPLVLAVARLPEPRREDISGTVSFPLENKSFVVDEIEFEIIDDDGITITISPLRLRIKHSNMVIDLGDRLSAIKRDFELADDLGEGDPDLAESIKNHRDAVLKSVNSIEIRKAADLVLSKQLSHYGMSNAASVSALKKYTSVPISETEEDIYAGITAKEGKILLRIHAYKERDKSFSKLVKKHYKAKNGGKLVCQACGLDPIVGYGPNGERCIEAHHKIPIEELQPDSETKISDMAVVCASCHRMIHSQKPCLAVDVVYKG